MTIVEAAIKDLGKRTKPGADNYEGFVDKKLEDALKSVGWCPGWAWDSHILLKWVKDSTPGRLKDLQGYFVASAMGTFRNLKNAGFHLSMVPTVGSLVFWQQMQHGHPLWVGHAGLVAKVLSDTEFHALEAMVKEVKLQYRMVLPETEEGLKVVGFITL